MGRAGSQGTQPMTAVPFRSRPRPGMPSCRACGARWVWVCPHREPAMEGGWAGALGQAIRRWLASACLPGSVLSCACPLDQAERSLIQPALELCLPSSLLRDWGRRRVGTDSWNDPGRPVVAISALKPALPARPPAWPCPLQYWRIKQSRMDEVRRQGQPTKNKFGKIFLLPWPEALLL